MPVGGSRRQVCSRDDSSVNEGAREPCTCSCCCWSIASIVPPRRALSVCRRAVLLHVAECWLLLGNPRSLYCSVGSVGSQSVKSLHDQIIAYNMTRGRLCDTSSYYAVPGVRLLTYRGIRVLNTYTHSRTTIAHGSPALS